MAESNRRIQFVVSGPFLLLLVLAAGLETAGLWLLTHQSPPPPVQTPPYYVNRTLTAVRPCYQCIAPDGKLKTSQEWKLGKPTDIPAGEQWWFAAIKEQPKPIEIDGIPLLAVHPAKEKDKPWDGFDQRRIFLVVAQDLDPRAAIEHPATPPPQAAPPAPTPAPASTPAPENPPPDQPVSFTTPQQSP